MVKEVICATIISVGLVGNGYYSPSATDPATKARVAQLEEDGQGYHAQAHALIDCMRNNAYTRDLLGQCIDDWFDAHGKEYGVDY